MHEVGAQSALAVELSIAAATPALSSAKPRMGTCARGRAQSHNRTDQERQSASRAPCCERAQQTTFASQHAMSRETTPRARPQARRRTPDNPAKTTARPSTARETDERQRTAASAGHVHSFGKENDAWCALEPTTTKASRPQDWAWTAKGRVALPAL